MAQNLNMVVRIIAAQLLWNNRLCKYHNLTCMDMVVKIMVDVQSDFVTFGWSLVQSIH